MILELSILFLVFFPPACWITISIVGFGCTVAYLICHFSKKGENQLFSSKFGDNKEDKISGVVVSFPHFWLTLVLKGKKYV